MSASTQPRFERSRCGAMIAYTRWLGGYHTHVADAGDHTPVIDQTAHYDSRCSHCFLGHSHSERRHEQQLAEWAQRNTPGSRHPTAAQ